MYIQRPALVLRIPQNSRVSMANLLLCISWSPLLAFGLCCFWLVRRKILGNYDRLRWSGFLQFCPHHVVCLFPSFVSDICCNRIKHQLSRSLVSLNDWGPILVLRHACYFWANVLFDKQDLWLRLHQTWPSVLGIFVMAAFRGCEDYYGCRDDISGSP